MKPIINSILDTDLYKFSMQNFIIQHYPDVESEYTFNNRDKSMIFNIEAFELIKEQVELMSKLRLTDTEYDYIKQKLHYLPVSYRQYLAAYRFNPSQVHITLEENGELNIRISGKWRDSVLWEVPLMAIISEIYFRVMDEDWNMDGQIELINSKGKSLSDANVHFADFGTRRRRNYEVQDMVVRELSKYKWFVGTSNPYLAMKYNVTCCGTLAHEIISGVAALDSLNHPNKVVMKKWQQTYSGSLGTMLPDTFGIDSFLKDFSLEDAKLWDGTRWDSGCEYIYTDKMIEHYKKLNIDPTTKTIIYSNALDVERSLKIANYCKGKIRCSMGIGTYFTSDFIKKSNSDEKSKPMNMVIKLTSANDVPCVKLSDDASKAIGDSIMVETMKYIHIDNYKK